MRRFRKSVANCFSLILIRAFPNGYRVKLPNLMRNLSPGVSLYIVSKEQMLHFIFICYDILKIC